MDEKDFYTLVELADLLDMHPNAVQKHISAGRLKSDYMISGSRVFRQETVDEFVNKWIECEGYTLKEIATKYGVNRDAVYWHVRNGRLEPIGWFRGTEVYRREDAEELASEMGWLNGS